MDVSTLWSLAGHAIRPTLSEVHELHVWTDKANQFCIAKSVHIVEVMYEVWYCACFKNLKIIKFFLTEQMILHSTDTVSITIIQLLYSDLYKLYRLNCNSLLVM